MHLSGPDSRWSPDISIVPLTEQQHFTGRTQHTVAYYVTERLISIIWRLKLSATDRRILRPLAKKISLDAATVRGLPLTERSVMRHHMQVLSQCSGVGA